MREDAHVHNLSLCVGRICKNIIQICESALLTREPVREGFEPSVAFWATAL